MTQTNLRFDGASREVGGDSRAFSKAMQLRSLIEVKHERANSLSI